MSKLFLVLFFTGMLAGIISNAQVDDCELKLNQATEEFNAGHFYNISLLLKDCIDRGFTREQRQRAYLLLTQTYLLLDDPIGAESSYLKLLQANPEFVTDPDRDPIDVVYLSKKFTAEPVFSLSARIGANTSLVSVIKPVNIGGEAIENDYILKPGWMVGVGADWHLSEKISVMGELHFVHTAYRREQFGLFDGNSSTDLFDRQNWINLPLSVKYTTKWWKLYPYVYGGGALNVLIGDRASIILTDSNPLNLTESPILNFRPRRYVFNRSIHFGMGAKYKIGLDYLFADLRYSIGMTNLFNYRKAYLDYGANDLNSDNLLESGNPIFRFATIDNFFRLNTLYVTVGYIHPLYKPRKIKKPKTGSILRKIRKESHEN